MKEKYCAYCRNYRPDEGFKLVMHGGSGTQRSMCKPCQQTRRKPRSELQALADRDRRERKEGGL